MKVFREIQGLPKFNNPVVTIGSFDGVHQGHLQLIKKIKSLAKSVNGEDVLVFFHPHPRSIVFPNDNTLELLTDLDEKLLLLEEAGVSNVVIVPFTVEFSQLSPRQYVQDFIIKSLQPHTLVVGYDHKFGLNRKGDFNLLKDYQAEGHFQLVKIDEKEINDLTISSTNIRNHLKNGKIYEASVFLGTPYKVSGKVVHGQRIGNQIGFPTANIQPLNRYKLIPKDGVYAVKIQYDQSTYNGMLYIGHKPSLQDQGEKVIEVNIFDFNQVIYGEEVIIEFHEFVRGDIKFNSLEDLKAQLNVDKKSVQNFFTTNTEANILIKPSVAIVILNWNGKKMLQQYLHTVKNSYSDDFKIYVIDNGSSDDSLEYLHSSHPEVELIILDQNYGYTGGYNRGLAQINADYYVLMNSDIEATNGWLDPLIAALEKDPTIACAMPKMMSWREKTKFEYAGASGGMIDLLGYPFCRGRLFVDLEEDKGQYDDVMEVAWVSGAAFVVRSTLFNELGGFDDSFFAHQEEIDLCIRLKSFGYKCIVMPISKVFHLGGGTLDYEKPFKTYLNFRNNISLILKVFKITRLLYVLPARLLLDGVAGIKFLVDGKPANSWAVVKAHFAFYCRIPALLKERKRVSNLRKRLAIGPPNTNGIYKGTIIWNYFIKGEKKYSEL